MFLLSVREQGFSEKQADAIAPQVERACVIARTRERYGHKTVEIDEGRGYVLVECTGRVTRPRLDDGSYGFTNDSSRIPTFLYGLDFDKVFE